MASSLALSPLLLLLLLLPVHRAQALGGPGMNCAGESRAGGRAGPSRSARAAV